MNISRVLVFATLSVGLAGCPDGKTQSSNRTTGTEQVAGDGTVVSGSQTSANAVTPQTVVGVKNGESEKTQKQEPKNVETKTVGNVGVHTDKVTVSNQVAKKDNISVVIEPAPKKEAQVAAEPQVAVEPQVVVQVPAETVPVADISSIVLEPDTEYVITVVETAPNGEVTVAEQKTIVTLAQEPMVNDIIETSPDEFQLTVETGSNPPETLYTVAVIGTASDEVIAWVNPSTGLPVKTGEDKWAPVASEPADEDGSSEAIVLVKELGLDSDLIEFAVQAKNQAGDETPLSESLPAVKPDLLSGPADSEAEVQVAVPSNAPLPLVNQIAAARDDIKELRAKVKKLKGERKDLNSELRKLNTERRELSKLAKSQEKGKKADKNEHGKTMSALAKIQKDIAAVKAKSEKLKTELKDLQKLLAARTAELKSLKKQRQAERLSRKS